MHTFPARRVLGFLLILALATVTPAFGQSASAGNGAVPVIQIENVPLPVVIENLARQAEINFILDPKVADTSTGASSRNVTLRWENLTAELALRRLLETNGLHLVQSSITGVWHISVTNRIAGQVNVDWVRADTNAVPLIQFSDVELDSALKQLAKDAKLELEIDPAVARPTLKPGKPPTTPIFVSARWQGLTLRQAIGALCENYELTLHVDPTTNRIRIGPRR